VDIDRLFAVADEFAREAVRVLVVEDSDDLAENIAELLRQRSLDPIVAATVHAAMQQRHLPQVAIVDLRLPDGSGLEAVRRLAARDPNIRVLLTTGYIDDARVAEAADIACIESPVLQKPVSTEALAERVEEAARWSKQKRS
jgi:DNA-binding NtrC family response regulator